MRKRHKKDWSLRRLQSLGNGFSLRNILQTYKNLRRLTKTKILIRREDQRGLIPYCNCKPKSNFCKYFFQNFSKFLFHPLISLFLPSPGPISVFSLPSSGIPIRLIFLIFFAQLTIYTSDAINVNKWLTASVFNVVDRVRRYIGYFSFADFEAAFFAN